MAGAVHRWVPYIVGGKPSASVKQATDLASGAYAIRRKDSRGVVYVGESNLGHMWRTLARHFQAPASFTKQEKPGGANAFATDSPGDYEVTWQITSRGKRKKLHGDQKALNLQARWIRKFRKAGHRLHNRDDGMSSAQRERARQKEEKDERDTSFEFGANAPREWYENPAAVPKASSSLVELGRLTCLSFWSGRGAFELRWTLQAAPVLAYDGKGRLFIVYTVGSPRRPSSAAELRAARDYKRSHWGATGAGKVRGGELGVAPWRICGEGFSVTYTTRKGSDRDPVDYVHRWGEGGPKKFTAPVVVEHACQGGCVKSCAARGMLSLAGGSYRVEDRGIVG